MLFGVNIMKEKFGEMPPECKVNLTEIFLTSTPYNLRLHLIIIGIISEMISIRLLFN